MSKQITLDFNSEIRSLFTTHKIPTHDGLCYLLSLHYGLLPSFIPEVLEKKILATGIVTKDYENNVYKWNIPLFEETEIGFEWIGEWMDLFKNVNPERRGVKADVLRRMKKFFVNNPAVRKQEVIDATKAYLLTLSSPMYCKKSHKFIYEMDGSSMLKDYVNQLQEKKDLPKDYYVI